MLARYPIIGLLALGLTAASLADAQHSDGASLGLKGGRMGIPGMGPRLGGAGGPRDGLKKGHPPPRAALERWREMGPEERQQMVDRLPPERREGFRRRMEMWDSLKPAERKGAEDRFDRFRDLPPAQQKTARQAFRQFNRLPHERRQELRREMAALRRLNEDERATRMNSEDFQSKFDPHERGLLQDLATALPD